MSDKRVPHYVAGKLLKKSKPINSIKKVGYGNSELEGVERGVIATKNIIPEEEIERSLYIETNAMVMNLPGLSDVAFQISDNQYAIGLGLISVYNHSDNPNADWEIDTTSNQIIIKSLTEIESGQEITINYGKDYWKTRSDDKV